MSEPPSPKLAAVPALSTAPSDAVRFTHFQEVAAAGRDAEHVPQSLVQFLSQPSQAFRTGVLVVEGTQSSFQQFSGRFQLFRFDVVRQTGHVAAPVVGTQVAGLALRSQSREEAQFVPCCHPAVCLSLGL